MRAFLKLPNRRTLLTLVAVLALAPVTAGAQPADYPNNRITFVCAFPAGSGADILVRYLSDKMAKVSGQTVMVENKPGANGNIAAEYTVRAKPDGYTVYVHSGTSTAANMSLFKRPTVDVTKDLRGVQFINKQPFMIAVPVNSPAKDINDLTALMKERKGEGSYGVTATSGKVLAALYKEMAGFEATEVSYKTGPEALNDISSGALDFVAVDPVFALAQQKAAGLRLLAVSSPERMKATPDIPAMTEYELQVNQLGWWGVFVPANTSESVINKLNALFKEVLDQPETIGFLNLNGGDVYTGSPSEVDALLAQTVEEWRDYVQLAKIPQN